MAAALTVLSGSANVELASNIAGELHLPLAARTLLSCPDGELLVEIDECVRGRDVYLVESLSPPVEHHLLELVLLADACCRAGAARLTAVVPYLGYARQDRRTSMKEALGAHVIADLLQAAPLDRIVVVDLHAPAIEGCFRIPIEHLTAVPILTEALRPFVHERTVIVAPDLGAVKLASQYAKNLDRPLAIMHKTRLSGNAVIVHDIVGDVRDRSPVIVDDMLSTGGTISAAVDALVAAGARPDATVAVTHGLFVGPVASMLLPLPLRRIVTTDSVAQHHHRLSVDVCTLGPLLAEAIRRLNEERSLDELYRAVPGRGAVPA